MDFGIDFWEMFVVGVVALIVIGPKELPGVLRMIGKYVAKVRAMAGDFRNQFDEAMREAELDDVRKQVSELSDTARSLNPVNAIKDDLKNAIAGLDETMKAQEQKEEKPPASTMPYPATKEMLDQRSEKPVDEQKTGAEPDVVQFGSSVAPSIEGNTKS